MDAATGARMAEAEPQQTAVGEGSDGHAAGDMLTGPCPMDIDKKESSARGAQQGSEPELNASRTEWVCVISRSCAGSFEDEHAGSWVTREQLRELYKRATQKKYGFLYYRPRSNDLERMFFANFTERLLVS